MSLVKKDNNNLPELPKEWSLSEKGLQAIKTAVAMSNTKHGLIAGVPIVCKGTQCPYRETCVLIPTGMYVEGERCPLEIAAIIQRFEGYVTQLGIESDNYVDLSIVKNLVDIEIQICRADKKVAINGDFIENVIAAISPQGDPYYKPELSKAADFKLRLLDQHAKLLGLLHSTRKDKAGDKVNLQIDASNYAANLLKRKQEIERDNVIDVTPDK